MLVILSLTHVASYANPPLQEIKFSGFIVKGLGVYTPANILPLYETHLGRTLTISKLHEIANQIQNYYRQNGYALAQVYIPKQVIRSGLVMLQIEEGLIDEIRVAGAFTSAPSHIRGLIQDIDLNIPLSQLTLQRILFYLNNLHGYNVKPRLIRENISNRLILELVFSETKGWNGYFQVDRRGIKAVGKTIAEAQVSFQRVFNSFDQLKLTYTGSEQLRELENINVNYQFSLSPSSRFIIDNSWTESRPGGDLSSLDIFIKARHHRIGFEKYYFKNAESTHTFGISLAQDKIDASVGGLLLSQDNTYVLRGKIGWQYTPDDARHLYDIAISQGLKTSATKSVSLIDSFTPTDLEDFTLYSFDYQYFKPLTEQLNLSMQLKGQYASSKLPIAYKYAFGGSNLGRGYDAAELIGDHGISGAITLQKQLQKPLFSSAKTDIYAHYDIGSAWNRSSDGTTQLSAASIAAGVNLYTKRTDWNLEVAAPLTKDLANEANIDKVRLFLKFKYRFN